MNLWSRTARSYHLSDLLKESCEQMSSATNGRYEQQVGPQQAFGFDARTKALMNFPSTSDAMASTSIPWPLRNARASSMRYTRVGSTAMFSNPTAANLDRYSFSSSAPAMQPTHNRTRSRTSDGIAPRVTTSETAKRPPGFRTRNASWKTRSLSAERLITQLEMITSTELSGSGMCSISPFKNSTFSIPERF